MLKSYIIESGLFINQISNMLFRRIYLVLLIAIISNGQVAYGQGVIKGILLNKDNKKPIPYAAVGIIELGIGTITNRDGTFKLALKSNQKEENINFSSIGYESLTISAEKLLKESKNIIYLKEKITKLEEVEVSDKRLSGRRRKVIGNSQFNTGTLRLDSRKNGGAMALLVSNDKDDYKLIDAKLFIVNSSFESYKLRARVMEVDSVSGLPGQDIMEEVFVSTFSTKKGWVEFDFRDKRVHIDDKEFYLVFEWVMDSEARQLLAEQIKEHLSTKPENITASTVSTAQGLVEEKRIKDFKSGVWFGSLIHPIVGKRYTCYYRLNALDSWKPSAAILATKATILRYNGK